MTNDNVHEIICDLFSIEKDPLLSLYIKVDRHKNYPERIFIFFFFFTDISYTCVRPRVSTRLVADIFPGPSKLWRLLIPRSSKGAIPGRKFQIRRRSIISRTISSLSGCRGGWTAYVSMRATLVEKARGGNPHVKKEDPFASRSSLLAARKFAYANLFDR